MREAIDASQQDVTARFLRMLSISLEQVGLIRSAIQGQQYAGLSARTHELEHELDELEREVEDACLNALARYQPLATDLRFFLMVFKCLTDMERAGDYGRHVGRDLEDIGATLHSGPIHDVLPLTTLLSTMIERLAYAFAERDIAAAHEVMRMDYEEVDALYEQMQRASLTRILENPRDLHSALKANRMARSLERLGDHLVNVAERVEAYLLSRPGMGASEQASD
ncbi:phosphate signaling complex protein PhoU [Deinococcus sonorensis]|uniref:Phosphate-specific transport system accessory protein PhoU n=2 Tax=Deinococcus sonorensis TaxID=309891 RepID=A0AAU7UA62_9DEIO